MPNTLIYARVSSKEQEAEGCSIPAQLKFLREYALIDRLIEQSDIAIHLVKENVILSRDSRSNEKFIFGIKALMAKNYVDNLSVICSVWVCKY